MQDKKPPITARLVILRHGETDYNREFRMTGQRDIPLNERGIEQAREAGLLLSGFCFDKVFASHLERAFNTAILALETSGSHDHLVDDDGAWDIEKRPEIAEVDTGDFTGRCHQTDPEIMAWVRHFDVPLPGGESDRQAVERVGCFYETEILPRLKKGEDVLVVVHAGIVRAFDIVMGFETIPENGMWAKGSRKHIPNAQPHVIDFENGVIIGKRRIEIIVDGADIGAVPPSKKNNIGGP